MKHKVSSENFSFAAIATILTGRVFADKEFERLARFLSGDSPNQVMADRESKWIPWILVQFPFLSAINTSNITDANAAAWFEKEKHHGTFTVRAVHSVH